MQYHADDAIESKTRAVELVAAYLGEQDLELFLMLDLDGTLVADDTESNCVVLRPWVEQFLLHLHSRWPGRLSVFTAASAERAQLCVQTLQKSTGCADLFVQVWSGERARIKRDAYKREQYKYKPLKNVAWKSAVARTQGWTRHNTILIDNTPQVAQHTYVNLLCIRTFNRSDVDRPEQEQEELRRMLDRLDALRQLLWTQGTLRPRVLQEKIAHIKQCNK